MSNPFESGGGLGSAPESLDERAAQLREVLNESAGALVDSLVSELDLAVEQLSGRELAAKLDDIEDQLMSEEFESGSDSAYGI